MRGFLRKLLTFNVKSNALFVGMLFVLVCFSFCLTHYIATKAVAHYSLRVSILMVAVITVYWAFRLRDDRRYLSWIFLCAVPAPWLLTWLALYPAAYLYTAFTGHPYQSNLYFSKSSFEYGNCGSGGRGSSHLAWRSQEKPLTGLARRFCLSDAQYRNLPLQGGILIRGKQGPFGRTVSDITAANKEQADFILKNRAVIDKDWGLYEGFDD